MCGFMSVCGTDLPLSVFKSSFHSIAHRGPDASKCVVLNDGIMGFHRLAIMGLSEKGMQPMEWNGNVCICNGEIYNYRFLAKEKLNLSLHTGSDCEVLLPLYCKYKTQMFDMLDGEFAMVCYIKESDEWIAARDSMGIRPMFYGFQKGNGRIAFASEAKALLPFCDVIHPFPIGTYYKDGEFHCYHDCSNITSIQANHNLETLCKGIRSRLESAVLKRLHSDAPIGFLLSGGLDSSLVCSIAAKHITQPIKTFAIGMDKDAIDLSYAREVADFIGSEHHEFLITKDDVLKVLPEVIYHLESYDITTIRASVGMYLLCKKISEEKDVIVLLSGEISDELFGYKYTDYAPSAKEFQKESEKRIRELYQYDVLRADRCIAAHAMEARVPFSDKELIAYIMRIDPELKRNHYGIGKYLLRHAFTDMDLPKHIRMREKAAFSDAVGHSLVDDIQAYANQYYDDATYEAKRKCYTHAQPFTKESLYYRELFESFFPNRSHWIKGFWMPNATWPNCDVNDPSARVLKNYGNSGQ